MQITDTIGLLSVSVVNVYAGRGLEPLTEYKVTCTDRQLALLDRRTKLFSVKEREEGKGRGDKTEK
jgi:hypothetical protein